MKSSFNHSLEDVGAVVLREGGDGLAPVGFECTEAVMNEIPYNACLETLGEASTDAQHLQPTYRLTCYQTERSIILGLARVDSNHPTCIEWALPVQLGSHCALIQISNDGTFEWVGTTDAIIEPKSRPQGSPHPPASK